MLVVSPALVRVMIAATAALLSSGCSFLLPTSQDAVKSKWTSYKEAQEAFDRIVPGTTGTNELVALGFHPAANPNARLLTYLDVIQRFMPNRSISTNDLDPAVREFIQSGDDGQAWEVEINRAKAKRRGNALLDVTGFDKKNHATGWRFKSLFLILDGRVVYKLASGIPHVEIDERRIKPLGPFQEVDSLIVRADEPERKR